MRRFSYWRDLQGLGRCISGVETMRAACAALVDAQMPQALDLMLICEAWLLQLQLEEQSGPEVERETQQVAAALLAFLARSTPGEASFMAALDVLRALPARTGAEICLLGLLVEQSENPQVQHACITAVRFARPLTGEGWQEISILRASAVGELAEVAAQVLQRKSAPQFTPVG